MSAISGSLCIASSGGDELHNAVASDQVQTAWQFSLVFVEVWCFQLPPRQCFLLFQGNSEMFHVREGCAVLDIRSTAVVRSDHVPTVVLWTAEEVVERVVSMRGAVWQL